MNIIDLATVPHQILSVRLAITNPKKVLTVGTIKSQPKLFKIHRLKLGSFMAHI